MYKAILVNAFVMAWYLLIVDVHYYVGWKSQKRIAECHRYWPNMLWTETADDDWADARATCPNCLWSTRKVTPFPICVRDSTDHIV